MNDSAEAAARRDENLPRRGGWPLAPLSLACIGLLIGGIAVGVAVGGVMPLPYGPASAVTSYVRAQPVAVRIIAVVTFASSVPLALYAAIAAARLRQLEARAGTAAIALTGGALAAGALGLAGLLGWTLSIPEVAANVGVGHCALFAGVSHRRPGAHCGVGPAGRRNRGFRQCSAAQTGRPDRSTDGGPRRSDGGGVDLAGAGRHPAGREGPGADVADGGERRPLPCAQRGSAAR